MNGTKKVAIISDAASTGRVSLEIGIPLFFFSVTWFAGTLKMAYETK